LLTALRYSREGILEMGAPAVAPTCDKTKAVRLLWSGLVRYMERNGTGFVLGRDGLPMGSEGARNWPHLMEAHGLHPDLQMETRSAFSSRAAMRLDSRPLAKDAPANGIPILDGWPVGLQEALRRGCRLACEPVFNAAAGCLEFVWVASRDMLEGGENWDWRGSVTSVANVTPAA
jgi:putative hemolysin